MEQPDNIKGAGPDDEADDATVFVAEADTPAPEDQAAQAFDAGHDEPAEAPEEPAEAPGERAEAQEEPAAAEPAAQESLEDMVESLRDEDHAAEVAADAAADTAVPETAAEEPASPGAASEVAVSSPVGARERALGKVPFYVIAGLWPVFSGVMTYLLWPVSGAVFVGHPLYAAFVWGGAALFVAGFVAAAVVLAVLRAKSEPGQRRGLARAVLVRVSVVTAIGVVAWWAGLLALDLHRLGRLG